MATLAPLTGPNARVSPELFDAMVERGDLAHVHVELLDGTILFKLPQGALHLLALAMIVRALNRFAEANGSIVVAQGTVPMGDDRPEPDVALLGFNPRDEFRAFDGSDVRLLVEVSVSSLALDRRKKTRLYASHAIPEYWIVNPVARQVEVYRDPSPSGYASLAVAGEEGTISALALPGSSFSVADLMPRSDPEDGAGSDRDLSS